MRKNVPRNRNPVYPDNFNALFEQSFQRAADQLPLYSDEFKRKSWQRIKPKLRKQRLRSKYRKWMLRYEGFAIVGIAALLGIVVFTPPSATGAVSPIYQELRNLGNGVSQIIFLHHSRPLQETLELPDNLINEKANAVKEASCPTLRPISEKMQLNEVYDTLTFSLPRLTYIPEGYDFVSAELISNPLHDSDHLSLDTEADQATGIYMLLESPEQKRLTLIFKKLLQEETIRATLGKDVEQLKLSSGITAYYTPGKTAQLTFLFGDLYVMIAGELSKDELIAISEGLKTK